MASGIWQLAAAHAVLGLGPHMVVVFHDSQSKANDDAMRVNYVEYGRQLEKTIKEFDTGRGKAQFAPVTFRAGVFAVHSWSRDATKPSEKGTTCHSL